MKKLLLVVSCVLFCTALYAQGIVFEEGTWEEALAKAKRENKVLFVDVYTSWCGPCKIVAKTIFTQPRIGDYYNRHFVNFKLDAEVGEGPALKKKYQFSGYPTFLFLDGDGKVLYRFSGVKDIDFFLKTSDMVRMYARYGGWEKIQADYEAGVATTEVMKICYEWASLQDKPLALNKYLNSMSEEQLFSIETGKMIEDKLTCYDNALLNKMVDGRVKLGKQEADFDYYFTGNLKGELNHFLQKAIQEGDRERLEEIFTLKRKLNAISRGVEEDNDIRGDNWYYVSEEMIRLYYLMKSKCDENDFKQRLEAYMHKTMENLSPDTLAKQRAYYEQLIREEPCLTVELGRALLQRYEDYIGYMLDFVGYYWRLVPSDKASRKLCMEWVRYLYAMNPYNSDAFLKGSGLMVRMKYEKEAIAWLQEALEKQYFIQGPEKTDSYNKRMIQDLQDELRDVKNKKI